MGKSARNTPKKMRIIEEDEDGFLVEADEIAADGTVPGWMDCTWKRVPCWEKGCPVCGRVLKDRAKHLERGDDPDSFEAMLEDVGEAFRETAAVVGAHAKKNGFDAEAAKKEAVPMPPKPSEFPLYNDVARWFEKVSKLAEEAGGQDEGGQEPRPSAGVSLPSVAREAFWVYTEDGVELLWYKNTLSAKTYRQLLNRWHLDRGDDYGEFDHAYTKRVLGEVISILEGVLARLERADANRKRFRAARAELARLSPRILSL